MIGVIWLNERLHTNALSPGQLGGGHVATQLSGGDSSARPRALPKRGRRKKRSFIANKKKTEQ